MLFGMKRLTTAEVARRLGVAQVTVNVWCLQGRFTDAVCEQTPRGPVWVISERDLKEFKRPKRGRPVKVQPAKGQKKKKR
jgi:hypothetical protein